MKIICKFILGFILIIACGAKIIASDKPILLQYHNEWYSPILVNYTNADFGGSNTVLANYHNLPEVTWCLYPIIPYNVLSISSKLQPPSKQHILGTNASGQDMLVLILYGLQTLVFMGLVSFSLSLTFAFFFGIIQGYYGGWVDVIMQRFYEVFISIPVIYVVMLIGQIVELNTFTFTLVFTSVSWVTLVPVIRTRTMVLREVEFVKALRGFKVSSWHIMYRHISPQIVIYLKGILPLMFIAFILSLVGLEFLGGTFNTTLGIVSLGGLIWEGQQYLSSPWIIIAPSVILLIILLALVVIVDGSYTRKYHY
ncbi:Inner membrane ABC transporter permease protein YejE [Candidatus Hepatincola sp. Pdp]